MQYIWNWSKYIKNISDYNTNKIIFKRVFASKESV